MSVSTVGEQVHFTSADIGLGVGITSGVGVEVDWGMTSGLSSAGGLETGALVDLPPFVGRLVVGEEDETGTGRVVNAVVGWSVSCFPRRVFPDGVGEPQGVELQGVP